jgi:WAS protein family homolog 1
MSRLSLSLICSALMQLSNTVDVVFQRIEKRLTDERQRVTKVNERVATCHGKINTVRGSNKATTVFSTSKFPAPKYLPAQPDLFGISEDVFPLP